MPAARSPCPHFPDCVSCPFVGTPYPEQLARKEGRVRDALARHATLSEVRLLRTQPSPRAFGYRQVVKLVARRGREGLRLGVYRPGTASFFMRKAGTKKL